MIIKEEEQNIGQIQQYPLRSIKCKVSGNWKHKIPQENKIDISRVKKEDEKDLIINYYKKYYSDIPDKTNITRFTWYDDKQEKDCESIEIQVKNNNAIYASDDIKKHSAYILSEMRMFYENFQTIKPIKTFQIIQTGILDYLKLKFSTEIENIKEEIPIIVEQINVFDFAYLKQTYNFKKLFNVPTNEIKLEEGCVFTAQKSPPESLILCDMYVLGKGHKTFLAGELMEFLAFNSE